jgi:hypothetical protein
MKAGELYRYPEGRGWCRHGLLLVEESRDGRLVLRDTYWSGHSMDDTLWKPEQLEGRIEFVLDLSNARKTNRHEFDRFREEDRAYIPMGGHREECWVRKDAEPDPALVEDQIRCEVETAKSALRSAQFGVELAEKRLAEFLKARGEA